MSASASTETLLIYINTLMFGFTFMFFAVLLIFLHFFPVFFFIKGTSVKYNPQRVGLNHVVHDEDVIEIVKKIV
jgi:hypothetical protein